MEAYDYAALWRHLKGMRPWQIIALGASCAEKVTPIVHYLALPDTWDLARRITEFSWSTLAEEAPDVEEASRLQRALESMPEWQIDYPDSLPFVVTQALDLFQFALATVTAPSIAEKADHVGFSSMLERAELFDLAIEQHPELTSPGRGLRSIEEASQRRLVAILDREERPSERVIHELRREAKTISDLFEGAMPVYCFHIAWALIRTANRRG